MDPRTIRDSQFAPIHFVYADGGFTIAFGLWEDEYYSLGMRWDGEGDAAGYPLGRGGRPKWLVVKQELAWPILCSLLAAPASSGANVAAIVAALNVVEAERVGAHAPTWLVTLRDEESGEQWPIGVKARTQERAERWALDWGHEHRRVSVVSSRVMAPQEERESGGVIDADGELSDDAGHGYGQECSECHKPIGPLHPAERIHTVTNGMTREVWRHVQPCPTTARPTGERAFPFLPPFPPAGDRGRSMATNEPTKCPVPGCGAPMRRGRPHEHPKDCQGQTGASDHYNGICQHDGKLYCEHLVCTQIGDHRLTRPIR